METGYRVLTFDKHDWRGGEVDLTWFTWAGKTKPVNAPRRSVGPRKIPAGTTGRLVLAEEDAATAHVCLFIDGDDSGKFKIELSGIQDHGGVDTHLSKIGEPEEVNEYVW